MVGAREGRMRRRRQRLRERRREREASPIEERERQRRGTDFKWIATWNVQRLSMRINNREMLGRVVTRIEEEGYEIVLLSEILVER